MISNREAADILTTLDFGSGVAETDPLLETARIETSVFDDLMADRVDLVPGTKGSGKTALYRIFVDFLPSLLLENRQVVIAHGVQNREDTVFLAFQDQFDRLSESEFVDFWCIYLMSLAYEQFVRNPEYESYFKSCEQELSAFRKAYKNANIPDFERKRTLKEILAWTLAVIKKLSPRVSWKAPEDIGQFELSIGGEEETDGHQKKIDQPYMPLVVTDLVTKLEALLEKADLSVWLMVDRLDELFARRSTTERNALRGLLRTIRLFGSAHIRVKLFLRDDILEQIVENDGFTALSHIASRRSDTLRWSEEQILAMITRRIAANTKFSETFSIDAEYAANNPEYQRHVFYEVFADTVYRPPNQSETLRWIYNHVKDGRGVVTPRDVITLLTRAGQRQRDTYRREPDGSTDRLINGPAIIYGLNELSKEKRTLHLEAEFPHLWKEISRLVGGGTQYSEAALKRIFGQRSHEITKDLVSIGLLERGTRKQKLAFSIPFLYRTGLECTQKFIGS